MTSVFIHFDAKSVSRQVQHTHLVINAINIWQFIFSTYLICLAIFLCASRFNVAVRE